MSSTLPQQRPAVPRRTTVLQLIVVLCVFLTIWFGKLTTIGEFGTDIPYWDQWGKEGEFFYQPWFEKGEFWNRVLVPHNEHRIAPTLAMNLALVRLGGDQWDARVQCAASAALHALLMAGLAWWALRRLPTTWGLFAALVAVAVAAPPIAWENVLGGFQSQFYFLALFSLVAMAGLLSEPWSWRWWAGVGASALACVSMGSGMLLAAPVAAIAGVRLLHAEKRRDALTTLTAALAIGGIGWAFRAHAPWHESIHARSLVDCALYVLRCLAWPTYERAWVATLIWAPWIWLAVRRLVGRDKAHGTPTDFVLAAGMWVILQAAAVSYSRAGASAMPAPRYGDICALGTLFSAFALAHVGAGRRWGSAAATTWSIVLLVGLCLGAHEAITVHMPRKKEAAAAYEKNVQAFVLTDDYGALEKAEPLPFPIVDWFARILRNPALRALLPQSIRAPVSVPGLSGPVHEDDPVLRHRAVRSLREPGEWTSAVIPAGDGWWKIEMLGDTHSGNAVLEVRAAASGRTLAEVRPSRPAGQGWRAAYVPAPDEPAVLHASVRAPGSRLGFSEPVVMSSLSYRTWRLTQHAVWFLFASSAALLAGATTLLRRSRPVAPTRDTERVAGLDLLRALAITGVLLSHTLPFLYAHNSLFTYGGHLGSMGVDLFFVLSGFLIGGILWRLGDRLDRFSELRQFWARRWLRTLPNFYVFLALTVALATWFYHRPPSALELTRVATFTQNLAWAIPTIFPEAWTLAVEEWFYLLTPVLLWLGLKLTGRFKVVWWSTIALMLIAPFVLRTLQSLPNSWGSAGRQPVVFRLDSLAIGVAMAALRTELPLLWRRTRYVTLFAGLALAGLGYVLMFRLNLDQSWFAHTGLFTLISVGFALLLPWASEKRVFGWQLGGAVIQRVAVLSYSLYLCNVGVCVYLQHVFGNRISESLPIALGALAAAYAGFFVVSELAYRGIERPVLELRDRITRHQPKAT